MTISSCKNKKQQCGLNNNLVSQIDFSNPLVLSPCQSSIQLADWEGRDGGHLESAKKTRDTS